MTTFRVIVNGTDRDRTYRKGTDAKARAERLQRQGISARVVKAVGR